jgi:hypothetical protein
MSLWWLKSPCAAGTRQGEPEGQDAGPGALWILASFGPPGPPNRGHSSKLSALGGSRRTVLSIADLGFAQLKFAGFIRKSEHLLLTRVRLVVQEHQSADTAKLRVRHVARPSTKELIFSVFHNSESQFRKTIQLAIQDRISRNQARNCDIRISRNCEIRRR